MHKQVVNVIIARLHILFGCQPNETVFKQKNSQRINSIKEHIKAHVKFQTINQIWISNILLSDAVVLGVHI